MGVALLARFFFLSWMPNALTLRSMRFDLSLCVDAVTVTSIGLTVMPYAVACRFTEPNAASCSQSAKAPRSPPTPPPQVEPAVDELPLSQLKLFLASSVLGQVSGGMKIGGSGSIGCGGSGS